MVWYKFYLVLFKNKKHKTPDGKVLVKFGITHHMKVEHRFDPSINDGYTKNYEDWDIKILFSIACKTKQDAEYLENYFLKKKFPYNSDYKVWVEDLFGMEDRNYYYDNTGVTELRLLSEKEKNGIVSRLFDLKHKLNGKPYTSPTQGK